MKVFVSHASEDKDDFVRPLADALSDRGLDIWYDEYVLRPGGFDTLMHQLRPREVLIAHGSPYGTHECAAHVTDEERMLELERDWQLSPCYFAVDVRKLLGGFDDPLPTDERRALLDPPAQPVVQRPARCAAAQPPRR